MWALADLTAKCERGDPVNMKRKWKGKDITISEDIDQICSPTTNVEKKGKKKHNKKKIRARSWMMMLCLRQRTRMRRIQVFGLLVIRGTNNGEFV